MLFNGKVAAPLIRNDAQSKQELNYRCEGVPRTQLAAKRGGKGRGGTLI